MTHLMNGAKEGTGYYWSTLSSRLDKICPEGGLHECNHMTSELAENLARCMRLDKIDLQAGVLQTVTESGDLLSWKDRTSLRANQQSEDGEPERQWVDVVPVGTEQDETTIVDEDDTYT